ncbi:hypothetical protein KIPB_016141, partial [Kipferlia bialata]|eukprot:g16141.t1
MGVTASAQDTLPPLGSMGWVQHILSPAAAVQFENALLADSEAVGFSLSSDMGLGTECGRDHALPVASDAQLSPCCSADRSGRAAGTDTDSSRCAPATTSAAADPVPQDVSVVDPSPDTSVSDTSVSEAPVPVHPTPSSDTSESLPCSLPPFRAGPRQPRGQVQAGGRVHV